MILTLVIIAVVVVVVYTIITTTKRGGYEYYNPVKQSFTSDAVDYWPQWYYANSKDKFPWNMYSRMRYISPSYYTGSGRRYEKRPGARDDSLLQPRDRWINHTAPNGIDGGASYYKMTNQENYLHGTYGSRYL